MTIKLGPAARTLLQVIAENDHGEGVDFEHAPRGRWRLPGTGYVVNGKTFHDLDDCELVDVGDGRSDPVKVTQKGRDFLAGKDVS